jgi:hypothetical protein
MPASGRNPVKQSGAKATGARAHVKQAQHVNGGGKTSISAGRKPVRQSPPPR